MSQRSSSPFVELRSSDNRRDLQERVSKLEYENSTLRTEKRLLEQSNDSSKKRYEDLLARKNEELAALQSNFDYVFNQRKELQSKLQNQKDIAGKTSSDTVAESSALKKENRSLKQQLDRLERSYNSVSAKCEHLRADLNRELSANDQYRDQVKVLEKEIQRLSQLNDDILERLKLAKSQSENGSAIKTAEDLRLRYTALQSTNSQLQSKVDQLLQHKTSVELLKQKCASLSKKAEQLESAERKAAQSEIGRLEIKAKFDEYFGFLAQNVEGADSEDQESQDSKVSTLLQDYRALQNKNLVLYDKLNQAQVSITELTQSGEQLIAKLEQELEPENQRLKIELQKSQNDLKELQKTKVLNTREIEFLRKSVKELDAALLRKQQGDAALSGSGDQDSSKSKATNQYLSSLEKLVDDYKHEIENLRQQKNGTTALPLAPTKRPRILEDDTHVFNTKTLRNENIELLSKIKGLRDEVAILKNKLDAYDNATQHTTHILELRRNPFNKDQLVKQETLDLLRQENEALITKYVNNNDVSTVPRAIFARQENDKENLQTKIDQLNKKISRLTSVYADKSKKIMSLVSKFFGYSIEFVPSPMNPNDLCSKMKLFSKFHSRNGKESEACYLTLDVHTKDLKAHGTYDFRNLCSELVTQWVNEKDSIPCFLSALNLRLYQNKSVTAQ
ncbi:hypothetical protein FT663_02561 [Candidozyma haemuli var. vulneris]|uniref:Spindle assembly checkpoint component MAD1 n=1 Tax=Candidozyma haemuli TaxID=45357 RepID=A0A2V1AY48_9ASCO|nr:hypothetical protein CXQ85_005005 [[Candida] haemuloni]KAF3986896.1 hypothetical protein FT662_04308 [[Candida] haemuloni var. vulneris]KAF3991810.1 hypothetical protein FT663_02561 [[Candida] haemuloni var. vulneris]PVH22436.1 hypothetical protein CXQ85_005005 [[Candida] haemuloni]